MMRPQNILSQNIYSPNMGEEILIIGTCIPDVYPEVFKNFKAKWDSIFSICLE